MERIRKEEKVLDMCRSAGRHSRGRLGVRLVVIAGCACLVGCTTLKKAGLVGTSAALGGAVASIASSSPVPVILGSAGSAFVTSAVVDLMVTPKGKSIMNEVCAPDNFWSLLGTLIEMGGWALILIVIVPMLFSWLIPGPTKLNRREKG